MKSSLALLKDATGSLNSSRDHFGLHQEKKNVRVTMEVEVLRRPIFEPTLSTIMVRWILWWERQKEILLLQMTRDHDREMPFFFLLQMLLQLRGTRGKGKEKKVKHTQIPKLPFLDTCIQKNQHMIHFLVHGHSILVHIPFAASEEPKGFKKYISQNNPLGPLHTRAKSHDH